MTTFRLRALRLSVTTERGETSSLLPFRQGLNVLRADNSSGKSTVLQSIIYAMGLEGMLSARREIPLAHVMTDRLIIEGSELRVLSSKVLLELENGHGQVVTLERVVKDPKVDRGLVGVWSGPLLTEGGSYDRDDYFVRRAGAAQRKAGFHKFLAEFLGWDLPTVTRADGSEVPLYLECLFPYFYVEQKHGWIGLQARIPTYFGIREVGKRSAEYVLGLDFFKRVLERQRIVSAGTEIEATWQATLRALRAAVDEAGGVLTREPAGVVAGSLPGDVAAPKIFVDDEWLSYDSAIRRLEATVRDLKGDKQQAVGEVAVAAEAELLQLQPALNDSLATLALILEELADSRTRETQLELRVEALGEDLQRHKDSLTLQGLGSARGLSLLSEHLCPTCHQHVGEGSAISAKAMTIGENITFVEQQLAMFRGMAADTARVSEALEARRKSLQGSIAEVRRRIRVLKDDLTSGQSSPSVSQITHLVSTEARLDGLQRKHREVAALREDLASLSEAYGQNRALLRAAQSSDISVEDKARLARLEAHVRAQLERYHFRSLKPQDVEISQDTYRPAHEGFDLGFDLSASDMIRLIWAYLIGILHVSEEIGGNHPGLLIFDEPRQQETAQESYRELLRQAADEAERGEQLLFATSERLDSLTEMLSGKTYNLISFAAGQRIIGDAPSVESHQT